MIRFFLRNHVVTNLLSVFFLVVGGWMIFHVKREAFPDVRFDIATITTFYPGATPSEVERLVTRPIEDAIRTVRGIDRVESYSVEDRSVIVVRFIEELSDDEVRKAVIDVTQAVGRAPDLPEEAEEPLVTELTSDRPLIALSVAGADADTRDRFAEKFEDELEDLPGVSRVEPLARPGKEIWVEADLEKLLAARVTLGEIARAVAQRNLDVPAGALPAGAGREALVRAEGGVETSTDVARVILRGNDERSFVRVRDVARVSDRFADEKLEARAQGRPAIKLQVFKRKEADTLKLTDAVRALEARMRPEAAGLGLEIVESEDFSFFIRRRLNVMTNNLLMGGALILASLFLFLDWRLAIAALWGTPLAFAAAMTVGIPAGFTINLLTLMALIIVLGLMDDDAVVTSENIYRHLEMGKSPLQAAEDGAREVVIPVTAGVLTTMAAFVPFALITGIMGKFMWMIPVTVVLCLAGSLLETFTILPAHVLDLLKFGRPVERDGGRWYHGVLRAYRRALTWGIGHRYKFFGLSLAFLALTGFAAWLRLKVVMFPEGLIDQFFIQLDMPRGTSIDRTRQALEIAERAVVALPASELDAVTGTVGLKGYEETVRRGTQYGQLHVTLVPQEKRKRLTDDIIDEIRGKIGALPGAEKVVFEKVRPGPPVGKAVLVRVRGRDPEAMRVLVGEVREALAGMPGVLDIRDSSEGGKDELRFRVVPEEAAFAGLDAAKVSRELMFAAEGGEAASIRRGREEVKVRVRLEPADRRPEKLADLRVMNDRGQQVRLGAVTRVEKGRGPAYLEHYNFRPSVTVTADVDPKVSTSYEVNAALVERFADAHERHPGFDLVFGGEEEQTRESIGSLRRAMVVALVLDFVIIAGLFGSYWQPFLIMLTIPIGLVGVAWALILHGQPASFMATLGMVAMTGVVVNNAVLLIDFVNELRSKGVPAREAVVEAGALRLRAIWASSLTTLAGLFPTAYGLGGREPFVQPMSLALAWGLAFATPLTLLLIPLFYVIFDDAGRWFRRRLGRPEPHPAPAAPRPTTPERI